MWTLNDVKAILLELRELYGYPISLLTLSESKRMKQTLAMFCYDIKYTEVALKLWEERPNVSLFELGLSYDEAIEYEIYEIRFSTRLLIHATYDQLKETVIHEYAHFLRVLEDDDFTHGIKFKEKVIELGGHAVHANYDLDTGKTNPIIMTQQYYFVECERCGTKSRYTIQGKIYKAIQAGGGNYQCSVCGCHQLKAYQKIVTEPY
ncbi:MAG: SprT-like domain-containing protein [Turicibacter sp.]